jgi:pimeloyl-ACP methyl ester carboxylesterase
MNVKRLSIAFMTVLLFAATASAQGGIQFNVGGKGRADEEKTKNVHGAVVDQAGKPIAGARVVVTNSKDKTSRTVTTDEGGNYAFRGLAPDVNHEVRADFKGAVSELKSISSLLDREDNLINFQLPIAGPTSTATNADPAQELQSFDLVRLKASFEMPQGVPAPIPAVLLLHGYGENRKVWDEFRKQFLERGWAVMSLDLRGHGDSLTRNQRPIQASPAWRNSPREFPLDVIPALDWLKRQTRLNSSKIVIVGYDIGANLALVSSGKFREVRTVVAVNPNLKESLEMAGSAQDFRPRSALVVTENAAANDELKSHVKEPFRSVIQPVTGGTTQVFQGKALSDAIFQWIKETY